MLTVIRIRIVCHPIPFPKTMMMKIYKTIILPVAFYGCEIWSHTLREEHSLRVFENRVLRGIFGHKREEIAEAA